LDGNRIKIRAARVATSGIDTRKILSTR